MDVPLKAHSHALHSCALNVFETKTGTHMNAVTDGERKGQQVFVLRKLCCSFLRQRHCRCWRTCRPCPRDRYDDAGGGEKGGAPSGRVLPSERLGKSRPLSRWTFEDARGRGDRNFPGIKAARPVRKRPRRRRRIRGCGRSRLLDFFDEEQGSFFPPKTDRGKLEKAESCRLLPVLICVLGVSRHFPSFFPFDVLSAFHTHF